MFWRSCVCGFEFFLLGSGRDGDLKFERCMVKVFRDVGKNCEGFLTSGKGSRIFQYFYFWECFGGFEFVVLIFFFWY